MRARRRWLATGAALGLFWGASALTGAGAHGQARVETPTREQQDEAQREMELGVADVGRGEHASALAHFLRAQALVPEANLPYRFAGEALEELGRYEEAIASFETYLRIRPNVRDAGKVRGLIEQIRTQKLEGLLDVISTPTGSAVFLDDGEAPIGETPLHGVRVRAGGHVVRIRFLGYREAMLRTRVEAGSRLLLQSELERVAAAPLPTAVTPGAPSVVRLAPVSSAPPSAVDSGPAWYAHWWLWAGAGVVVVAGAVTAVVLATSGDAPTTQGGTHRFPEGT